MKSIVVDASALVEYLLRTERAAAVDAVIRSGDNDLHAPALIDVEVAAALRRVLFRGAIDLPRAGQALEDQLDLPLRRYGHQALLPRILSLRENFSAYDAAYVSLAERLGAALLTMDGRLARAVGKHLDLEILPDPPP